jgi:hypothetical protein
MHRALTYFALAVLALHASAGAARAQLSVPPDQIEEDWQLVIANPDPVGAGPQLSTSMSPVADGSTPFFVFDMNYRDSPSFSPGGMQVQVWSGETMLSSATQGSAQCNTVGETITWTQRIKISSGVVSFAVDSGRSTTWGKFGQGQQLNIGGSFTTSLASLSQYTPATSTSNSGVGWQRNRVSSMTLVQVRYYAGGKLLQTDKTSRPIDLSK